MTAQQSFHFDDLLVQCRDVACARLTASLSAMLEKADESITALAAKAQDQEEKKTYLAAKDVAAAQRAVIESQFKKRYLGEFQQRTNRVKKIGQNLSEIDLSSIELEIVGDDDLNETLKFNEMGVKLHRYCVEELGALDQRVGVLLGDASLQSESNPFSPEAICSAFKQVCRNTDAHVAVRMVLLKLFDDHVLDDIRSIYKEVNELLVQNSILPKIRYGVNRRDGGKSPSAPRTDEDEAPPAAESDFFATLQKMMQGTARGGGMGTMGGRGGSGGGPVLQGPELLNSLTRIQLGDVTGIEGAAALIAAGGAGGGGPANVLHELKGTSVGAGMAQMDAMTLDIVALLFDQLFDNPKIPIVLKGLAARLQIPILKVAIADKTFFSKKNHPARQVLDTLGEIALRLPADFGTSSPLYTRLDAFMQELVVGFQEKIEIFDTVRARLEALIAENDQQVKVSMQPTAKALDQTESLALARAVGRDAIKARVLTTIPPRPVLEFLAQQWIKYLVVLHVRDGTESEAWKASLATVDQLVWSVTPKATTEERRTLANLVPQLLRNIKAGLGAAGVDNAVCMAFFKDLMRCHTAAIQVAPKPAEVIPKTDEKDAIASGVKVLVAAGDIARSAAKTTAANPATPTRTAEPAPTPATATKPTAVTKPTSAPPSNASEVVARSEASRIPAKVGGATVAKPPAGPATKITELASPKLPNIEAKPAAVVATAAAEGAAKKTPDAPASRHAEPAPEAGSAEDLDFTAAITMKNPFGEGEVKVDDLDFTSVPGTVPDTPQKSEGPGAKPARKPIPLPSKLVPGCWVEIRDDSKGQLTNAQLHHVSPLESHFLFVGKQGKKVYECSRAMLSIRINNAEIRILDGPPDQPLFEQLMGGVFKKLGKPVPA